MSTLNDMVDEIKSNLQGYTLRQDRISNVANPAGLTTTSTAITLGTSSNLAKGIVEIDDELIFIDSFDKATNVLNVIPGFGRGYQGTSPAPHTVNAQVTLAPTFPRVTIKRAINDTINALFPNLWAISSYTFTFNASVTTYALPDDVEDVLYISWQTTGSSQEWLPLKRWRLDNFANSATFNTNSTLNIYDNVQPGRTVQVYYASTANTLDSNTDDFADVTGLPQSCQDVVTLGASYKLLSFLDAGRINLTSAEADNADSKTPSTAGVSASRYIFALYQQRLNEEALKLKDKYPIRIHYTR